jgi:hypothetical protein
MTRETALEMIEGYGSYYRDQNDTLCGVRARFPEDGGEAKAMRWLGYCQGMLVERRTFTLDEVKEQSRVGKVPYNIL